jgi:HK97 family phage major capsid protein
VDSRQPTNSRRYERTHLETSLPYAVNTREEAELLWGGGGGNDLAGLATQATAFDTSLAPASPGWNRIDLIGHAIQQVTAAKELEPTFVVLHPSDWWSIRLTKDSFGRYILGDPQEPVSTTLTDGTIRSTVNIFRFAADRHDVDVFRKIFNW